MSNFSPFSRRKPSNRDESKDHDTVDVSSLKQQIHESDNHTLIVRKTGAVTGIFVLPKKCPKMKKFLSY